MTTEALLAEARALTDARLAARAERLRRVPGGTDGAALAYALGTSGKRVRPALVLASYRAAGGDHPGIAGVAAAVEIVHTYSLVHDDLPCMDDDAQRRGRPTVHVQFDVPTATLAGFLLVPVAVEELAAAADELALTAATLGAMAELLLEASGIRGMVAGQWLDLMAEGAPPTYRLALVETGPNGGTNLIWNARLSVIVGFVATNLLGPYTVDTMPAGTTLTARGSGTMALVNCQTGVIVNF